MQVVRWLTKDEHMDLSMLLCPDANDFMFSVHMVFNPMLLLPEVCND